MNIEMIDIQISNKYYMTEIALLVDKPDFLQDLARLREKWGICDTNKYSHFTTFTSALENIQTKEFETDMMKLIKKYKRGKNYLLVVKSALVTGSVPDYVYKNCYFDVATLNEINDMNHPENFQYIIVLSPSTEFKELKQPFKEFKKHIKEKIKFQKYKWDMNISSDMDKIEQYHPGQVHNNALNYSKKKELDRTREWYWLRYNKFLNKQDSKPLPYHEVLDIWNSKCKNNTEVNHNIKACKYCSVEDENIVQKAISEYIHFLQES